MNKSNFFVLFSQLCTSAILFIVDIHNKFYRILPYKAERNLFTYRSLQAALSEAQAVLRRGPGLLLL